MCLLGSLKSRSCYWLRKVPAQITWSNHSASTGRKYKPLLYVRSAEEEQEFKQQGFVMHHREADKTSNRSATLHQSKQTRRTFCQGRHFPAADSTQWLHFQDITVDLRGFSFSRAGKVTEEFPEKHVCRQTPGSQNHTAPSSLPVTLPQKSAEHPICYGLLKHSDSSSMLS